MKGKLAETLRELAETIKANKIRVVIGAVLIVLLLAGSMGVAVLSQKKSSAKVTEHQNTVKQVNDAEKPKEQPQTSKETVLTTVEGQNQPQETPDGQNATEQSGELQKASGQVKKSQEVSNSNPTTEKANQSENAKPAASGRSSQKKPIYKTIHHEAVTESRYVIDQKAWDEPIWKKRPVWVSGKGKKFYSADAYNKYVDDLMDRGDYSDGSGSIQYEKYQDGVKHHPERGHNETIVVKPAWDETVIVGWE